MQARLRVSENRALLQLALCDQFPNFGYEIVKNAHYPFRGVDTSFVLGYGILLGLHLVVSEYLPDLSFIPSYWKPVFAHRRFLFLRLRTVAVTSAIGHPVALPQPQITNIDSLGHAGYSQA